jgi:outer membrane protein assembly factor BamD
MWKSDTILKWFFIAAFSIMNINGCALYDQFFADEPEKSASELMSEGTAMLEKGQYEEATATFQKLKDRYPYSEFAVDAELKMADALYKDKLYEQAYQAYNDFERLHPKNPKIPYVIFQKGMCHFSQVSTIDRAQTQALLAKDEFERLVKKFPRSEYADNARRKIRECYINLAEYELYVGHYYFKRKKYRAAMERYRYIIENYPDFGQYHEALEYLAKSKERLPAEETRQEELKEKKKSWWFRLTHPFD